MDSSYIVKSNEWIMPAISVISIVMSIIMTLSSFNKQKSLHINQIMRDLSTSTFR